MRSIIFSFLLAMTFVLSGCEKDSSPVLPTVETDLVVTNILSIEATVDGRVISDGSATVFARGICWSTKTEPTTSENKTEEGDGIGEFSSKLTNLEPNTTYYVRAYATNSIGTAYGNETSFTTLNELTITTSEASGRTSTSAKTGGNIINDGGIAVVERGICWSRESEPTVLGNKIKNGEGTGEFTCELTDLKIGTIYYVRAYAINKLEEIFYGSEITFMTLTSDVAITTSEISDISFTSAKSGGNITNDADVPITTRGVCWNTETKPTISNNRTEDGKGTGEFSSELTDLTVNTKYYVRAYATNEYGDTFYGNETTFTTSDKVTVETSEVTEITYTSVKSGGSITSNVGVIIIERGVCWNTESNPTVADKKTLSGEGIGDFTSQITGLKTGTKYYMRAYAKDNLGDIYYGNEIVCITNYDLMDLSPGNLEEAIKALDLEEESSLILGGTINSSDFKCMRNLINKGNLTAIDLSNVVAIIDYDGTENSIPQEAFSGCSALSSFIFPSNTVSIKHSAFSRCSGLKSLKIPSSVKHINSGAFIWCSSLEGSLIIPNSVETIGNQAFLGCNGFNGSLIIGNSVTSIGHSAFSGCSGFTGSLTIPNSVTSIEYEAFSGCKGFNGSLTIPNSVTSIGSSAFSECTGFTGTLTIPNSVTSIGSRAFSGCTGFTGTFTIPNSVTSIESGAFAGCSGFTGTLTIPNSVTSLGGFSGCTGFTGTLTIPNSVTSIEDGAFAGCWGFTGSLTIPNSVTSIGRSAFSQTRFTGSLTIPGNVTSIGDWAFYECKEFTGSLTIPNSVTSIGNNTFYECSGFTGSLTIPNSVSSIGDNAFYGCSGFTGSLTISNSVSLIGNNAFSRCWGFTGSLTIPNSVTSIGDGAFSRCWGFTGSLTIPNSVTSIGLSAFSECSKFTGTLTIPDNIRSIGHSAFSGCSSFTDIKIPWITPIKYNFQMFPYKITIQVPEESLSLYQTTSDWKNHPLVGY